MVPLIEQRGLDSSRDLEADLVVIPRANSARLDTRRDLETRAIVVCVSDAPRLHARRHLDARVLRRRLHGGVPFVLGDALLSRLRG